MPHFGVMSAVSNITTKEWCLTVNGKCPSLSRDICLWHQVSREQCWQFRYIDIQSHRRLLGYNTCLATKTGLVSRLVLHLLSKLQNWIWPKTGQYKTCLVSNTKIEAPIWATKPKLWQSHLTSETVEIFIQNEKAGLVPMQNRFWCGRLSVGTKPVLVQQV